MEKTQTTNRVETLNRLIKRSNSGDQRAIAELLRMFEKTIQSQIRQTLSRHDDKESCAQECRLQIVNNLKHYDSTKSNADCFFALVIRRFCLSLYHRMVRLKRIGDIDHLSLSAICTGVNEYGSYELAGHDFPDPRVHVEKDLIDADTYAHLFDTIVASAYIRSSYDVRTILHEHISGLSLNEIAQKYGYKMKQIDNVIDRAMRRLRQKYPTPTSLYVEAGIED